jgi:hypothetical protein
VKVQLEDEAMTPTKRNLRIFASVAAFILLTVVAGCLDQPLTPGHRTLEGDVWVLKLGDAGDRRLPVRARMQASFLRRRGLSSSSAKGR